MNRRISTRVRQRCYFCVLVAFVLASLGQPMMPVVAAPALDDSASLENALVSAQLGFLSAPIVGEPAELVLTVSTTVPASVATQIVLPDAIQVLAGSLTEQADLSPGTDWRQAIIVRVASEGEFKITASVEGTQADGSPVSGQAHLYLAANTEMASASELPVAIAGDVIVSPPDPESEFSVEATQDGDEMSADPTPDQITMGDDTSAEPAVEFAGPDADIQIQENQGEILLDPDDERGLITLGDETPSVPKTGEHVFEGVLVSEEAAELQIDEQADLVTLGDDSADEPGVATDIGFRQEREETATLKPSIYVPFVAGSATDIPASEGTEPWEEPLDAADDVGVESESAGQETALLEEESGLLTLGDDSPAEPQVVAGVGGDLEITPGQDVSETTRTVDSQTTLIVPEDDPSAPPEEVEAAVQEAGVEAENGGQELAVDVDAAAGWITQGDDSPTEPQMTPGLDVEAEITSEQNASEVTPNAGPRTILIVPEDDPSAEPEEVEVDAVEVEGGGQELPLTKDPQVGWITQGDDSPDEPQVVEGTPVEWTDVEPGLTAEPPTLLTHVGDDSPVPPQESEQPDVMVQESATEDGWPLVAEEEHTALLNVSPSPDPPTVAESDESVNAPQAGVDLIVQDMWSTTNPLRAGDWENVTFRIKNQGSSSTSTKFYTKMWVAGTYIATWYTNGLGAGYTATGSTNVKLASPGSYQVKAQVDTTYAVSETNEANNTRTETWAWAAGSGVDLIVQDIWSTTAPLTAGQWENVTFRIKNQGGASTSTTFYTKMWVAGTYIATWYTSGLGAGYTATGSTNVKVASPGSHQVRVQVDATSLVSEINETNNTRTETWTWAPGSQVDLIVQDIWSTTAPLTAGQWENVTFRIKNQGSASTSTKFYTKMWVAGTLVGTWYTTGLGAGYTTTGAINVKVATAGSHQVKVEVDTTSVVPESNETNNVRTETWTWIPGSNVDLIVEDMWSTTNPLTEGQWENVTFRIKNQGTASTSTTFYIKMWVDSTLVGTWYANGLGAGYSAAGAVNVKVATAGYHTVKVEVDTTKVVAESNETNNIRSERWYWYPGSGVDLVVEDIWSTTNPLTAGQWENIAFRIKNQGTASTSTKFYIKMWVDSTQVGAWYANGLGAGYTATGAVNVKVATAGYHTVKVEVDTTKVVPETDETNNIRSERWYWYPGSGADLVVEDIWSTTNPLTAGQWENVTFRIKNQGTASTSTKFYTKLWVDSTLVGTWYTNGLSAGYSAIGSVNVKVASAGWHTVKAHVDATSAVAEMNETNNIRTERWYWNPSSGGVDLIVEDMWSTTNPLRAGDWENVTFRIKNQGTASTSTKFYVKMWVAGAHVGTWYANGLGAGYSAIGSTSVKVATPGTHQVRVQVDTTNAVAETNEANNVRTENWTWAPPSGVDLVVEDIWSTTSPIRQGDWERILFRIKNRGDKSTSTKFYTRMWVDSTSIATWYTNGLAAGYSAIGSTYVKVATAGYHTVKVQVDTTNAVLETNEANNMRTERWYWNPATGVDLTVEDIWSTTNPLTAGQWERIVFRIKNRGTISTSARFYTKMWVDSTLVHTWYTDGLNAGYSATGSINVKVASAGLHAVKVQVDTTSAVSETDETNNVRTETWRWDSGGVDLIVQDIWSTTTPLRTGEWEKIYFRIKNQGPASTSTKFYIKMWVDSTHIATWYANGLGAGYSATGSVSVKVASAGLHAVKVQVDTSNAVAETNETNNLRTETWRWYTGGVDLVVVDMWSTTNPLRAGEWENVTFRIKNQGTASTSTKFYTKMWVAGTHVGTWYTNGLGAGHSATGAINVKVSTPGPYQVKVRVDATNTVPESNETNNVRTETWSWGSINRPDLVVEDIWSTTTPLRAGQWENVTFRIKNRGTAPASLSSYGGLSSRLEVYGTEPGGQVEIRWDDQAGTPSLIAGDIATAEAPDDSSEAVAMSFFETYAPLYRMSDPAAELALQEVSQDDLGMTHVRYAQTYQGVQVFGADLVVHVTAEGKVTAVNGTYLPDIDLSPQPAISPEAALETARTHVGVPQAVSEDPPELVIYQHGPTAHLAWHMRLTSDDPLGAWVYFIDAHDGQFVTMYEDIHFARNRRTYTANNTTSLPGTLLIQESTPSHSDAVAWAAHVNAGRTYDYYHNTHGRDSFDNGGATLVSTVHYKTSYNNAFWSPSHKQVVYGDGDGVRFGPLGNALDVVAHEWTHAVTQHEANLVYRREPGALNESYSDVFAAMVDRNDWLMGEDVYTPGTPGDALRSMADPPKYNQPDHVSHSLFKTYPWWVSCTSSNDYCGVHTNSGVPNKAAYLLAAGGTHHGITVQAIGRSKTERIYYRALTKYLTSSSDFKQARNLTVQACGDLYGKGSAECRAVQDAFAAVGIGTQSRFYTRLYIDGKAIHTWHTNELKPGASATGSVNVQQNAGSHVLKVRVDYTNTVAESNEANNVRTETWTWQ